MLTQTKLLSLAAGLCLFAISSCGSTEIGNSKDVNPATVYISYHITSLGDDSVSFYAQFRFAGPDGTTLVLNAPAKIELDGVTIPVDSSSSEGAFYEVKKPVALFAGEHTVIFTGTDSIAYVNHFSFDTFCIAVPLPKKVTKKGLPLVIAGLHNNDSVNIMITDSGAETDGFDTVMAVDNNAVFLPGSNFSKLKNGPLTIQMGRAYERPLANTTQQGGSITFIYQAAAFKTRLRK